MKTLIIYHSYHHGNTEKIANVLSSELNADLIKATEINDFDIKKYDVIGIGSGIYGFRYHPLISEITNKLKNVEGKRFFTFATSGTQEMIGNDFNKDLKDLILRRGGRLVGSFSCRGFSDWGPLKLFGGKNKGRPNEEDFAKAKEFAQTLKPKALTLCLTLKEGKILLGMKKRGFGEGRWNGFGGKLDGEETLIEGAKREMLEESGLKIEELEEVGSIEFDFLDNNKYLDVHIFNVLKYAGEPVETEEMKPEWFDVNDIPFDKMWADDTLWMPLFLEGKKFKGKILFKDMFEIINSDIELI